MTMNMKFFILAAAATLLAACTQEDEVENNSVEARITAGVSGPKTRAVDNVWNADHIGVMAVDVTTTYGCDDPFYDFAAADARRLLEFRDFTQ